MLKLQTPVADSPCKVGISYDDKIMMLGSCFSDSIGRQLSDFGFDVPTERIFAFCRRICTL